MMRKSIKRSTQRKSAKKRSSVKRKEKNSTGFLDRLILRGGYSALALRKRFSLGRKLTQDEKRRLRDDVEEFYFNYSD